MPEPMSLPMSRPMSRPIPRRDACGFTLIEVLVVIAILGMLATLVATNVIDRQSEALRDKAAIDVRTIADAANLFYVRHRRHPTWAELVTPNANGRPWIE